MKIVDIVTYVMNFSSHWRRGVLQTQMDRPICIETGM